MLSNQCKTILPASFFLFIVITITVGDEFNAKKHVIYEMYCRSSNQSTNTHLHEIDQSNLEYKNFIANGDGDDKIVTGVRNCRWNWDRKRPTRIFVHGYYSDHSTLKRYVKAYLERGDFNVIAINWLRGANTINYITARNRILKVGKATAKFVDYLVTLGLDLNDLTCVGHSLGAHTCGIIGKNIKSGKLANIIALDPAMPLFYLEDIGCRLHHDDAKYVQVIHTSGGFLGVKFPIGHADFYPNFGCVQPLCWSFIPFVGEICSHTRVHDLFIESLKQTSEFWGTKCTYAEILNEKCPRYEERVLMGGELDKKKKPMGLFYLKTNGKSPFALLLASQTLIHLFYYPNLL